MGIAPWGIRSWRQPFWKNRRHRRRPEALTLRAREGVDSRSLAPEDEAYLNSLILVRARRTARGPDRRRRGRALALHVQQRDACGSGHDARQSR
jgi:hypothetical protein